MRFVRLLSMVLAVVIVAATAVHAAQYDRFGKGPTTIGLTPPGYSSGVYVQNRQYVNRSMMVSPSPAIATVPGNGERRTFSAEPSTTPPAPPVAPAAPNVGPCPNGK
jgi:hypothetical protein